MTMHDFLINNMVATLLGSCIGLERQWHQKNAGLKTNALVCLGSALFVSLSPVLVANGDSTRIAAQVVSGIGFLGAGVMFRDGLTVRGMNTATTIWCAAAIGVVVGAGYRLEAVVATCLVLGIHLLLGPLEALIDRKPRSEATSYTLSFACSCEQEMMLRSQLQREIMQSGMMLSSIESRPCESRPGSDVRIVTKGVGRQDSVMEKLLSILTLENGVHSAGWSCEEQPAEP